MIIYLAKQLFGKKENKADKEVDVQERVQEPYVNTADYSGGEVTPRPSVKQQLRILLRKETKGINNSRAAFLIRILVLPLAVLAFGIGGQSSNYSDFKDSSPFTPGFTPSSSSAAEYTQNFVIDADSTATLNAMATFIEQITKKDVTKFTGAAGDLNAFQEHCDTLTSKDACVYIDSTDQLSKESIKYYILTAQTVTGNTEETGTGNFKNGAGVWGVQATVDAAISRFGDNKLNSVPVTTLEGFPTRVAAGVWPDDNAPLLMTAYFICLGTIFMLPQYLAPMVRDRQKASIRQYQLMGVPLKVYYGHWLVSFSLQMTLSAIVLTLILVFAEFFPLSNGFLVFLSSFAGFIHLAFFTVFLGHFIDNEQAVGIVPFVLLVVSLAVFVPITLTWVVNEEALTSGILAVFSILAICNPLWGFCFSCLVFALNDFQGYSGAQGVGFSNAYETGWVWSFVAQILGIFFTYGMMRWEERERKTPSVDGDLEKVAVNRDHFEPLRASSEPMLKVDNLRKTFTAHDGSLVRAVRGLDLTISKNEVYALLGHNGAGKTTALSLLAGEIVPDSGEATYMFREKAIGVGTGQGEEIRKKLGFCPQHDLLFESISCKDHLALFAELKGGIRRAPGQGIKEAVDTEVERLLYIIKFPSKQDEDTPAGDCSGGMRRKISLAISMIGDPEIIFLDEPTASMDPSARRLVWDMIIEAKKGRSIILCTHFLDEAEILSDRVGIMNHGHMVADGSPLFLKQQLGGSYVLSYLRPTSGRNVEASVNKILPEAKFQSSVPVSNDNADLVEEKWEVPYGTEKHFKDLFTALDEDQCTSVAMDLTTLEEVFLKTGAESLESGVDKEEEDAKVEDTEMEQSTAVDMHAKMIRDVWVEPEGVSHETPSPLKKVWTFCKLMIKQRYRDKQVFVWVTLMPLLYVIGGFIAVKVINPPSTTAPSLTLNLEAVDNFASRFFSPVTPIQPSNTKNGITFTDSIPKSQTVPGLYTGNSEVPAYVGGVNGTNSAPLQFSTEYSYGVNVAQNAFAQTQTDLKITTVLVPLLTPGALPDANTDIDVGALILPILIGMGFLPLSYGVLAVMALKEQNFVSVFRMIGVSRLQMYQGVILSSVCTSFVPFLLIVIILSLALGVSLFANGGRWLATLLALFGYGYAIIPLGLAFIPVFPTLKAAQEWWPMIMLVLQIGPFIAYSIVAPNNADTARILVYAFGVLPPFAFQYVLSLYSSSEIVSAEWSEIWAWDTQLPYNLLMLYVMGTLLWLVVLFQVNHAPEWGTSGTLEPDVEVEDPDVDAERKRALQNSDGLNTRSTVRHFTVKEKYPPHVLLFYPYLWLLSLIRIFKFPELKTTTKKAVKGVSLGIKPGEILALLGPNGAGKSTLQNMVSRDLVPSGGSIAMAGVDRGEGEREGTYFQKIFAKGKLGYCTQNNFLFDKMSVIEHLNLFMELRGLDLEAHAPHLDAIIGMLRLGPHLQKPATKISGGQKRCVNAAMALIGYPELLQLDEISSGVDAEKRRMIWDILKPPAAGDYVGPAVLLCTHYMEEAIALGTRIAIMVDGEVITAGTLKRLKEKHCHANFLEVTFKEESWSHLNSEDNFMQALSDHGLEAEVTESLPGRLRVRLPIHDMSKNTLNLAKLFDTMESIFDQQGIEYYHIALQSLEQIFIELSKRQNEINEGTLKEEESEGGSPPKRLVRLASSAKVDDNTINAKVDDTV